MSQNRLVGVVGLLTWLMVGLPAFSYHVPLGDLDWTWVAVYAAFGVLFTLDWRRPHLVWLALAALDAIALVLMRCIGFEGALLALVAARLGGRVNRTSGVAWILAQTALLAVADSMAFSARSAWLLVPPYLALQLAVFIVFDALGREVAARASLAASNAELRAVGRLLADSGRMAERLRISQELHDALGHHLTALSLNLEAALQLTGGAAHASVTTAQSLARRLLGDVREIVAASRTGAGIDVSEALKTLIEPVPWPRIHLEVPGSLRIAGPERAHALIRCAQEIITNAARHAHADNLWISVRQDGDSVRLDARDDGLGSAGPADGFGIRGMRERLAELGGELSIVTRLGEGFAVSALLPLRNAP